MNNKIKNIKNRIFYIYVLKHPLTKEIKYVGVTCTNLKARLSQHLYDSKKRNTYKRNWINSLLKENLIPIIESIEVCDYKNYMKKEKYWISFFNNLTNTDKGGNGVVLNRTKESIKKSSEAKYKPIIAISENKKVYFFKSHKEASLKLKVPRTSIEYSLSKLEYCSYGFNFLKKEEYYKGLEELLLITPKKSKYKIIHSKKQYTPKQFSEFLNVSETIVYLYCEKKQLWENSHKYDGKKIEIIKI